MKIAPQILDAHTPDCTTADPCCSACQLGRVCAIGVYHTPPPPLPFYHALEKWHAAVSPAAVSWRVTPTDMPELLRVRPPKRSKMACPGQTISNTCASRAQQRTQHPYSCATKHGRVYPASAAPARQAGVNIFAYFSREGGARGSCIGRATLGSHTVECPLDLVADAANAAWRMLQEERAIAAAAADVSQHIKVLSHQQQLHHLLAADAADLRGRDAARLVVYGGC
eukprot:358827-Chlamydomonas_euryale.AAC.2